MPRRVAKRGASPPHGSDIGVLDEAAATLDGQ